MSALEVPNLYKTIKRKIGKESTNKIKQIRFFILEPSLLLKTNGFIIQPLNKTLSRLLTQTLVEQDTSDPDLVTL